MSDLFLIQLLGIHNKNRPTLVICTAKFHTQRSLFFSNVLWITTAEVHWRQATTVTNFTTYSPQATASETTAVRRHIKMMVNKQTHTLHQTIQQLRLVGKHKMSSTRNNLHTQTVTQIRYIKCLSQYKIFIPDKHLIMLNVCSKHTVTCEVNSPPAGDIPKLNFSVQICLVAFSALLFLFTLSDDYLSFHYGIHQWVSKRYPVLDQRLTSHLIHNRSYLVIPHLSALKVWSRRGTIPIHVYLYLYHIGHEKLMSDMTCCVLKSAYWTSYQTLIQDLLIQDQDQDSEVQDQNFDVQDQDRDSRLTRKILEVRDWDGLWQTKNWISHSKQEMQHTGICTQ